MKCVHRSKSKITKTQDVITLPPPPQHITTQKHEKTTKKRKNGRAGFRAAGINIHITLLVTYSVPLYKYPMLVLFSQPNVCCLNPLYATPPDIILLRFISLYVPMIFPAYPHGKLIGFLPITSPNFTIKWMVCSLSFPCKMPLDPLYPLLTLH